MRPRPVDFAHVLQGFLMGSADIVPGVSGGTVALVLGIYQRLVAAISRFDGKLLQMIAARQWSDAAARVDLRFLVALGLGILMGVASLATLMNYLLDHQRSYTLAVFFGLIVASSVVVARMIRPGSTRHAGACVGSGAVAALFAFWFVNLKQLESPPVGLTYFFFCGAIAICAMILPGVSGAFLLLILGAYDDVTDAIRSIVHFDAAVDDVALLGVFACGCAVGLVGFSKLLRRLLEHAHAVTMAVLCGFMIGSLWKLWPFQRALNPKEELKHRIYVNVAPSDAAAILLQFVVPAAVALAVVLAVEAWASRRAFQQTPPA